jgi:hypothetical protein
MEAASLTSRSIENTEVINQSSIPRGILNNDQGYYNNKGVASVTQVPSINLAYLSNATNAPDADVVLNLNPICLTFCDFLVLFFRAPGLAFWMNPANANSTALTFNDQVYESTQSKCVQFSLADQIKKAWTKKFNKSETIISPEIQIYLSRVNFLAKTLTQVQAFVLGLSFDEVISALISQKEIVSGDYEDKATVKFILSFKEFFEPLNITLMVNFIYIVQIPCFKNINECDSFCSYYSGDRTSCRKCFDETTSLAANLLGDAADTNLPIDKGFGGFASSDSVVSDNDSFVFSEISKLIKEDESLGSSLW